LESPRDAVRAGSAQPARGSGQAYGIFDVSKSEDFDSHEQSITSPTTLSDQDVLEIGCVPVLVDYWAEWCGPCKMIAPILDEVSRDYDGRVQVAKLNVDDNQAVAAKYGIRGIPTLMLFKQGEVVATKVGALSKSQLTQFLDSHL
jgi:thioredoxin 1